MQAGKLDRRLTIRRATQSDDGFQTVPTFADLVTVWASKEDVSDGERVRAQQIGASMTTRFRIRWSDQVEGVNPKDRVVCEGRVYDIVGVKEIGRREGLEITAAERTDD